MTEKKKFTIKDMPYWQILIIAIGCALIVSGGFIPIMLNFIEIKTENHTDYLFAEEQIDEWQTAYADYSEVSEDTVRLQLLQALSVNIQTSGYADIGTYPAFKDPTDEQTAEIEELLTLIESDIDELLNDMSEKEDTHSEAE